MTLYQKLQEYNESDYYGFHMPGHKRNTGLLPAGIPYGIDITEIEGFDDLHHASGIIKEAQERAAKVFGADETHFLVNGSTVGILSAILGNTSKGDTILVSRNCHKSVYHAIFMNELKPIYLYPEFRQDLQLNTEISVSAVKTALNEYSEIRAIVIVSPTYDGVVSDIQGIANAAHEKGIPLIVDEAHGAHFGFHSYFPENANKKGADIVIHSLHKTLPSLTQTALLHINGNTANGRKVKKYLDMLQSSSPSYVLMASIDACVDIIENRREEIFGMYVSRLQNLRASLRKLQHLTLIETNHFDPSKIVISVANTNINSRQLYQKLLSDYHLQMEMVAGSYIVAMTSVGDDKDGLERLEEALLQIDSELSEQVRKEATHSKLPVTKQKYTSAKMDEIVEIGAGIKELLWRNAIGYISTEYAYLYPPGIPLIVPGEKVTEEIVEALELHEELQFEIEGLKKEKHIEVWING